MTDSTENAFEAPKADLSETPKDQPILNFERQSAWIVFLVGVITFGIYFVYWFYSQKSVLNENTRSTKVSENLFIAYVAMFVISNLIGFFISDDSFSLISGLATIGYLVAYVMFVFSVRSILNGIINASVSTENQTNLGGILTFFFSAIYFQYKINEAIDGIKAQQASTAE